MNQVTLIGRLVKDPEIVYVKEKQKLDFTIAVNSGKENVDFIPCTAWGKTAENMAKYLKKVRFFSIIYTTVFRMKRW